MTFVRKIRTLNVDEIDPWSDNVGEIDQRSTFAFK